MGIYDYVIGRYELIAIEEKIIWETIGRTLMIRLILLITSITITFNL